MRISILTIGAVASIIAINSVFADTIVTSRQYVDTTRQATIPASGTNASTPGTTVVTYTNVAGTIGERGICNNEENDDCAPNDLVTVRELDDAVSNNMPIYSVNAGPGRVVVYGDIPNSFDARGIYDGSTTYDSITDADKLVTASVVQNVSNNLPTKTVTTRTCYQFLNGDCILWELQDTSVYGSQCNTASDCGSHCYCINHMCNCDSL